MSNQSTRLPTIAIVAVLCGLISAALADIAGIRQPIFLVMGILPLWAAIGILLRRVWSAYGFALYQATAVVSIPLWILSGTVKPLTIWTSATVSGSLAVVFFFAGRSLARSGARRGFVLPWILLALLSSVPFIFLHPYVIPTGAMENTLLIGDRLLVRIFPRSGARDGDIVVFHYPADRSQTFVKRVVGIHGDHIRMTSKILYRNGIQLSEPYVIHSFAEMVASRDNYPSSQVPYIENERARTALRDMNRYVINGDLVVPQGKYFVLGDNRDNSLDSRYWGLLDESDIIGKPFVIYFSQDGSKPRWDRLMKFL